MVLRLLFLATLSHLVPLLWFFLTCGLYLSHCFKNLQSSLFPIKTDPTLGLAFKALHNLNLLCISKVSYEHFHAARSSYYDFQNTGHIYNIALVSYWFLFYLVSNTPTHPPDTHHIYMHVYMHTHQSTTFSNPTSLRLIIEAQTFWSLHNHLADFLISKHWIPVTVNPLTLLATQILSPFVSMANFPSFLVISTLTLNFKVIPGTQKGD